MTWIQRKCTLGKFTDHTKLEEWPIHQMGRKSKKILGNTSSPKKYLEKLTIKIKNLKLVAVSHKQFR